MSYNEYPKEVEELAYDRKRYVQAECPRCIFIPSKYVMFSIMRACLGVKNPRMLWITAKEKRGNSDLFNL